MNEMWDTHSKTPPPLALENEHGGCRIWVGTSGYSYGEWKEAGIYPPGTKTADMLRAYALRFPVTELNYTWYQMPQAEAVARQLEKTPPGFRFAAKLTRSMTHDVEPGEWREQAKKYRAGIAPLIQEDRLLSVLVQLPPGFDYAPKNRKHLGELLDALQGLPLAVEFRHVSWAKDRVFAGLQDRRVTLVAVDAPDLPHLFPALDVVTNPDLFYIRFHGRNAKGWRSGNMQNQFDYDYSDAELSGWRDSKIRHMLARAKEGVLFFNNHVRGQAPRNAARMVSLIDDLRAGRVAPVE